MRRGLSRSRIGASSLLLGLAEQGRFVLLATTSLFLEYEAVLKRPEQRRASGLSIGQIDVALGALARVAEAVTVHFTWRPQLHDANDEMVLDAAVNGRADTLLTHDTVDFAPAAAQFRFTVMRPGEFLRRMPG